MSEEEIPQSEIDVRLALHWLLNPLSMPLESHSDNVQRIVASVSSKLPARNVDDATQALVNEHKRAAAEIDKAQEIASYNRAKSRVARIEEEEFSALLSSEEGRASLAARFATAALSADSLDSIPDHEPLIAVYQP